MSLPKAYEAGDYEKQMYDLWENNGLFTADPKSDKKHFSMAMPPPNETGSLHIGHALFLTLQDVIARHQRQLGKDVLWLPGTDHAALATNALVEKQLSEQGTDKHQIGRDEFERRAKEFLANSRENITKQIRAMGASCDWERQRYTLDNALNRIVNKTFRKMFDDGLIYRGNRIVNWDPKLETTVSDDEVDYKEETAPLYTLQYGPFQITTARPETKFGDKYVVMHPEDERYKQYDHGQTFEVEWLNGKITATVVKDEAVEMDFGTGVMTITPWHDKTDFEIAERHGLEKDQIIDFTGKLLPIAGEFSGENIETARPKIVDKLDKMGLLVSVDERPHNVALNSRGKGVIEPQIMLQWFVDVNRPVMDWKGQKRSLKEVMRAVVEDGDIKIIPKRFEKIYYQWIDNLYDWNISRQIWLGHQIPVWYKDGQPHVFESKREAVEKLGNGVERDPDTLDTWFSSALWTWSTLVDQDLVKQDGQRLMELGLPEDIKLEELSLETILEKSEDFQTYHPTDVMETGWDILFFWVARMILATTYVTGQIPFKTVYLHGLVRTEAGKKMSKSDPDSIVDPMEMIDEYGTDALRLALVQGTTAGADQRVGKSKVVANRNFANKLWNVARFIESMGATSEDTAFSPKSAADHWILNKLSISSASINKALADFRFSEAYETLYHFVWDDLADWYVEASKTAGNPALSRVVLEKTLILVHPFAPFVSEAIWQSMGGDEKNLLAAQPWPEDFEFDKKLAGEFEEIKDIVAEARRVIAATSQAKPTLLHKPVEVIDKNAGLIKSLARLGEVKSSDNPTGLRLTGAKHAVWLDISDEAGSAYRDKLKETKSQLEASVKLLEGRLKNQSYVENAPEELVAQTKQELDQAKTQLETTAKELKALS